MSYYWDYIGNTKSGKNFKFIEPQNNYLSKKLYPIAHQPTWLKNKFYKSNPDGYFDDYLNFIRRSGQNDKLKSFFTEHCNYLAVNTACKLNLFDALEIPKTANELCNELNLNEKSLTNLLQALHKTGYLNFSNNQYVVNEKSILLTENHPESLKYACMNWANEHLTAWQNLDYSIKTGKSAFEKLYKSNFFDYLDKHPEKLNAYHKAMFEYARDDYKTLPEKIDFSKHKSVMDCGGGYGAAINTVKERFPQIEYYLFDLPKVIEKVKVTSIQKIGGNFFEDIPQIAEAIILSRVLHDWNDEKARLILRNCCQALPPSGTLYVIENCADKINDIALLSLSMALVCDSFERTTTGYITLCKNQGFEYQTEKQLNKLQTILIFRKS